MAINSYLKQEHKVQVRKMLKKQLIKSYYLSYSNKNNNYSNPSKNSKLRKVGKMCMKCE